MGLESLEKQERLKADAGETKGEGELSEPGAKPGSEEAGEKEGGGNKAEIGPEQGRAEQDLALWRERIDISKKRIAIARDAEQKRAAIRDLRAAEGEVRRLETVLGGDTEKTREKLGPQVVREAPAEPAPDAEKSAGERISGVRDLRSIVELFDRAELEKERTLWRERVRIGHKRLAIAKTDEQKFAAVRDVKAAERELRTMENLLRKQEKLSLEKRQTAPHDRDSVVKRRIERATKPRPALPRPGPQGREALTRSGKGSPDKRT